MTREYLSKFDSKKIFTEKYWLVTAVNTDSSSLAKYFGGHTVLVVEGAIETKFLPIPYYCVIDIRATLFPREASIIPGSLDPSLWLSKANPKGYINKVNVIEEHYLSGKIKRLLRSPHKTFDLTSRISCKKMIVEAKKQGNHSAAIEQ